MTIDTDRRAGLREQLPLLGRGDEPLNRRFFETASIATIPKGQHICLEGSACAHLAILLKGTARVYKLGENGKEITLYRIGPGESCILTASCILSHVPFPAFAVCETAIEAAVIPAAHVRNWLAESTTWQDYIFGLIATRLSNIIDVVEEVVFRRMDKRIADHLCHRMDKRGDILLVTHQEIASELGTSREVVSRILKEFEQDSIIRVTRGAIELLTPEKLQQKCTET